MPADSIDSTNAIDSLATHQTLVQALLRSPDLPGSPAERELIQTHISSLVLAGDQAFKLRKPLSLGFLDFATAAQRRTDCEEEWRLNRRTAPALYLDVRPVFGPPASPSIGAPGEQREAAPIDWLLRMRRFDNAGLLDRLATAGTLGAEVVDALAQQVAGFHLGLSPSPPAYGLPATVRHWAIDNLDSLQAAPASPDDAARLAALRAWTEDHFARHQALIAQRHADGRVREGHGDLHLGNIVLWQGVPLPFDALEFNAELRHIDVVADVAFTFMDLLRHGLPGLAWRFISAWAEHTGEHAGLPLLHGQAVYRALVRAKVARLRAGQAGGAEAVAGAQRAEALDLALAHALAFGRHAPLARPRLVLTSGLSGSGKSHVALALVQQLGAVRLRSDVERKRLHGLRATERVPAAQVATLYGEDSTRRTFEHLAVRAAALLDAGLNVVVDAAFLRRDERQRFRALAQLHGAQFTLLACQAAPELLQARVVQRAAAGTDASDATLEVLARQREWAEPPQADEAAVVVATDQGDAALLETLARAFA